MLFQEHQHTLPFRKWLWKEKENRILIIVSAIVLLIQFSWFKYLYPFPNFIEDSARHITIAQANLAIGYFPIGYSKFLRLVSSFNSSHLLLIFVQYFTLQAAILYLIFSAKYLLNIGKWITRITVAFCILNPLLLHIANVVSADAWFTTLSLVWFSQLLWLLKNPGLKLLISHIVILLLTFITSHQAIYYPFVSVLLIIISKWNTKIKVAGISLITLLLFVYIGRTQYEFKKLTGKVQYSPFKGWQRAAEALYVYVRDSSTPATSVPTKFKELHSVVNQYMDTARLHKRRKAVPAYYYLWAKETPLRTYMKLQHDSTESSNSFKRWATLAPLYSKYSKFLEANNETLHWQKHTIPTILKYCIPDPEALGNYNMAKDSIDNIYVAWFGLKSNKIHNYYDDNWMYLPRYYPPIYALINLTFTLCIIVFFALGKYKTISSHCRKTIMLLILVWLTNLILSIIETHVTIREQTFSITLILAFDWLLIVYLIHSAFINKKEQHLTTEKFSQSNQLTPIVP